MQLVYLDVVVGRVAQHVLVELALVRVAPFLPFGHRERDGRIRHRVRDVDEGNISHCHLEERWVHVDRRTCRVERDKHRWSNDVDSDVDTEGLCSCVYVS